MSGRMTQEEFARVFGEDNLKFFKQENKKEPLSKDEMNISSIYRTMSNEENNQNSTINSSKEKKVVQMKKRNGKRFPTAKQMSETNEEASEALSKEPQWPKSLTPPLETPKSKNVKEATVKRGKAPAKAKKDVKETKHTANTKSTVTPTTTREVERSGAKKEINNIQNEKFVLDEEEFEKEMTNLLHTIYRFVTVNTDCKFQIMLNINNLFTLNRLKKYPSMYNSICFNVGINNYKEEISEALKIKKDIFIFVDGTFIEKSMLKDFYKTVNKLSVTSGNYCDKHSEENTSSNNLNNSSIQQSDSIKNFIRIKDYGSYTTKARLLLSIKNLQNDLIIIDPYYNKGHYFMPNDIEFMKYKKGNKITKRFIYAYLNVKKLNKQSKYFNANIILNNDNSDLCNVKFWSKEWYNMLCGNIKNSYIGDLISYGYDGIFIDGIEDD